MKFLLYFFSLLIGWGITFTGCGFKRYENIPLEEQNPIHLQAASDAESEVSRDIRNITVWDTWAYLGAGACFPLSAGTYLFTLVVTGGINDKKIFISCIGLSACATAALNVGIGRYGSPSNPPPERLIGKSPEYVRAYADAYRARIRSERTKITIMGSVAGSLFATYWFAFVISTWPRGGPG